MWKRVYLLMTIFLTFLMGVSLTEGEKHTVTRDRMDAIGSAIESYLIETGCLPNAADILELGGVLGDKLKGVPLTDAWGKKFHYSVRNAGNDSGEYWLGSGAGQDDFEGLLKYMLKTGVNERDIVIHNGVFLESSV